MITRHLNPNYCSGLRNREPAGQGGRDWGEEGHFRPSTPKLRVEVGRIREQSVYNYFYVLFLESSSTWQQGWGQYSGKSI